MSLGYFPGSYWATVLIYLILMLLPVWIGYRRRISRVAMLIVLVVGGLIPIVGFLAAFYIALRAESHAARPPASPSRK